MKKKLKENLALKIVSLVIAVLLWFYIQMVENPETSYEFKNVTVNLTNQAALDNRGLTIIGEEQFETNITLKCQRWSLNELKNEGFMVNCDLSEIYSAGKVVLPVKVVLNNDKISVVSRNPASITLNVDKVVTAEKPLQIRMNGRVKDGFYVNEGLISSEMSTVSVTGPETLVNTMSAGVVNIELNNRTESFSEECSVTAVDKNNEAISSDKLTVLNSSVKVKCQIYPKKVINIKVDNVNPDLQYELIPSAIEIAGPKSVVDKLNEITVSDFTLSSAQIGHSQKVKIKLPDNVIMITDAEPEIKIKGYKEGDGN